MCLNSCLCWKDLLTPSIAVVVFSVTTSMLQILVEIAVFTGTTNVSINNLTGDASTAVKLYMALAAFDFIVVLFGLVLLLAVEKNGGHRFSALPWIIWIIPYIIFESAVNIFYFSREFSNLNGPPPGVLFTNSRGYLIVPLVYWIVKDILLFIGWWCVVSRLCYWNHTTASAATDSTILLTKPTAAVGAPDSFGPVYYTGPSTHVQVRDNPRSNCAHVDVARPPAPTTCQSCGSNNWGMGGGIYGRDGGVYGQPKYVYNNASAGIIPTRW